MCENRAPINGGRVQFTTAGTDFSNQAVRDIGDPLYTVSKTFVATPLVRAYFSRANLDSLQNSIRRRIYELSKGNFKIGKQSETDLVVVMRSVFCMFSRNLCGCDVKTQVAQLNAEVLQMVVPNIYTRILNYMGYKRDVDKSLEGSTQEYTFMDRGVSTSGPSRKVLTYPMM